MKKGKTTKKNKKQKKNRRPWFDVVFQTLHDAFRGT